MEKKDRYIFAAVFSHEPDGIAVEFPDLPGCLTCGKDELEALRMALALRRPPKGIVHHSDRGVQYASHDYVEELLANGFRISMARKGNPYDNAAAESFIKTLKAEEVYLWEYRTMDDVQNRLPYFIEDVYNRKRLHSSLGYLPPVEFEEMFINAKSCPVTLTASV